MNDNTSTINDTKPATRESTEPETTDGHGRTIYHYLDTKELERLGVTVTLCGRLFFSQEDNSVGRPKRKRGWTVCPMCQLVYDKVVRRC